MYNLETAVNSYQVVTGRVREGGQTLHDHNMAIWNTITATNKTTGLVAPTPLRLAVELHDVISDWYTGTNPTNTIVASNLINSIVANPIDLDIRDISVAIGFAVSAEEFEKSAESWRENVVQSLNGFGESNIFTEELQEIANTLQINQEELIEGDNFISQDVKKIATELNLDFEYLRRGLVSAITDKNFRTNDTQLIEAIYRFEAPMANFEETMINTLRINDIEGLIIKAAEVMDNLNKPNKRRQFSAWRDAQELLSFYGPMLEMAGLNEYASKAYDLALQHLNKDRIAMKPGTTDPIKVIDIAKSIHEQAEQFIGKHESNIRKALNPYANVFVPHSNITLRAKSVGRITKKILEKDINSLTVPDAVGIRVILSPSKNGDALKQADNALEISEHFQNIFGGTLQPQHTREGEPHIEIHHNAGRVDENTRDNYLQHGISLNPARKSGLQTIHINFQEVKTSIGIEIQAFFKTDKRTYEESGHHTLYVNPERTFGTYGRLRRLLKRQKRNSELRLKIEAQLLKKIDTFIDILAQFGIRSHDYWRGFSPDIETSHTGLCKPSAERVINMLRTPGLTVEDLLNKSREYDNLLA